VDALTTKSQLQRLFFYSFSILFVGMGVLPVLPHYAAEFGATATVIGLYLSVIYIAITASTMLTGFLSVQLGRRRLFILAGAFGVPVLFLLGQVTALWQLVILTAALWFFGGIGVTLINVFTGLYADQENRGRWFGMIALTAPLGALTGGLIVGRLVDGQGYPLMFAALSLVWAVWPVLAYLRLVDKPVPTQQQTGKGSPTPVSLREMMPLLLLLMAILLSMTAVNVGRLSLPLTMKSLAFTPGAVSTAMAMAGLVTLPFAYFLGSLSDRLGRKTVLIFGYLVAIVGVSLLIISNQTWQFWISASLLLIAMTVSGSVTSAFATDLLTPAVLVRVLPWFSAMGFIAGILGFAGAGFLMENLGPTALFVGTAVLPLIAIALVWPLRCERQIASIFEPGWSCDISFRTPPAGLTKAGFAPKMDTDFEIKVGESG
jgi:MFS family permease